MELANILSSYLEQPKIELGDRSTYVGASDVGKCPRQAVLSKIEPETHDVSHYRFFEMEVHNAIQTWNEIHSTVKEERKEEGEGLQDQEGCTGMGSGNAAKIRRRVAGEDRHNLLD